MDTLPISVVMGIYNEPVDWIKQAIDSILNQTVRCFEFIIINDNPDRDENSMILNHYAEKDARIVVLTNEQNIGLTKSLNRGLKIAKGRYIARMDADDISLPARFEKQLHFMDANPEYVVCGTNIKVTGGGRFVQYQRKKNEDEDLKAQLHYCSVFAHPSVFIRSSALEENGIRYDENFRQAQDYKLWADISKVGKFYNIKDILFKYRVSKQQVSKTNRADQVNYARTIRIKLLKEWIVKINSDITIPADLTLDIIRKHRANLKKSVNTSLDKKILRTYCKILYLSCDKDKFRTFLFSIYNGDIFKMNYWDLLKFIVKTIGLRKFEYLN